MIRTTRMEIRHEGHAEAAGELARERVLKLGGEACSADAAARVATELAANILKHTPGGELLLGEVMQGSNRRLDVHALDRGSGIRNVGIALRGARLPGGGPTGLGVVKQLAEKLQIHTRPGQGTVAWAGCRIAGPHSSGETFDYGGISVAVRGEEICGDAWDIRESPGVLRVMVADGLGHGPLAAVAAGTAVRVFQQNFGTDLPECLRAIHQELTATRGAAATLASIDPEAGGMTVAGVGNVTARILAGESSKTFAGDNGTLGAGIRKITQFSQDWKRDSVLVLHSDGISSRWDCSKYPGVEAAHPALIAGVIYRDFRNRHDDSTVVVIRQRMDKPACPVQSGEKALFADRG